MEEIEVPLETAQEHMHEAIQHSSGHSSAGWISWAALASGIIAVFAAVASLSAGSHANEAMLAQIKAANAWNYYQAKGVKAAVLTSKDSMLTEMGRVAPAGDAVKLEEYSKQQDEISKEAKQLEEEGRVNLALHEVLAKAVTMFQVAIALGAISVLSRKRMFWYFSLMFACIGLGFFTKSFF